MLASDAWFTAPDTMLTRLIVHRGLGVVYVIAFVVTLRQFRPLLGARGLLPVPRFVAAVPFRRSPSLFHLRYSDRLLVGVASTGAALALAVVVGLVERAPLVVVILVWTALWALYLSIVNVGQTFYGFGWETLLLEAGFLGIFLGPRDLAPPVIVLWLFRWLAFRVELGAGLIKMRGDPCWRNLTCLDYHHETQPLPNPLSWYFHHLPRRAHRIEVLANHVTQLALPFGLLLPQPIAGVAAALIIVTQCYLMVSGNFSWLNLVTIVVVAAALPDRFLDPLLPDVEPSTSTPTGWIGAVVAVAAVVGVLSIRPVLNMLSSGQRMNTSFDPLHLVNSYGAFGLVTKRRDELIVEGTNDETLTAGTTWRPYEFKAKPGDPRRRPPQVAPAHLRLDWLMWFAAMSPPHHHPWVSTFVTRLLEGDRATLHLLRRNPFPDGPPTFVRVTSYRYRFTTREERRRTGEWWSRTELGPYLPPTRLR